MEYKTYLRSKLWKHIRRNVLRRDRWVCQSCGEKATQVHHVRYDGRTMRGQDLDNLMALCDECHEAVSRDMFGMKRAKAEQLEMARAVRCELKRTGTKAPKLSHYRKPPKLDIEGIRALSQQYAEGRMK